MEMDIDTDYVSTTSTGEPGADANANNEYAVERVLADAIIDGERKYLVKWEGYKWHECTWEPRENLQMKCDIVGGWYEEKRERGDRNDAYMAENIDRYNRAREAAQQRKRLRHEKRKKKIKQRLEKTLGFVESPEAINLISDSDDDVPLMTRRKTASANATPREEEPDTLFVQEARTQRKPPLEQSSSSEDESLMDVLKARKRENAARSPFGHPFSSKFPERPKTTQPLVRTAQMDTRRSSLPASSKTTEKPNTEKQNAETTVLGAPQIDSASGPLPASSKTTDKPNPEKTVAGVAHMEGRRSSLPAPSKPTEKAKPGNSGLGLSTSRIEKGRQSTAIPASMKSVERPTTKKTTSSTAGAPSIERRRSTKAPGQLAPPDREGLKSRSATVPGAKSLASPMQEPPPKKRPESLAAGSKPPSAASKPSSAKTGQQSRSPSMDNGPLPASEPIRRKSTSAIGQSNAPGPIPITNQAPVPKRKEWDTENHYKTLKMRYTGNKRSNIERAPADYSVLPFVNEKPTGGMPRPVDNPYGRRELPNRRVQPEESQERSIEETQTDPNKPPVTCFEWRNRTCNFTAEQCRWQHCLTDPLVLSPADGSVPPKYRKPPITCYHYMKHITGCRNEDCAFAHYNTGWLGHTDRREATKIDPNLMPVSLPPKDWDTPITCYHYMLNEEGCHNSADACRFAHYNTGLLGHIDGPPTAIDPAQLPRSGDLQCRKRRDEEMGTKPNFEITCRFWSKGHCRKTERECKFKHYDTGTIAPGPPSGGAPRLARRTMTRPQSQFSPLERGMDDLSGPSPSTVVNHMTGLGISNVFEMGDGISVPQEGAVLTGPDLEKGATYTPVMPTAQMYTPAVRANSLQSPAIQTPTTKIPSNEAPIVHPSTNQAPATETRAAEAPPMEVPAVQAPTRKALVTEAPVIQPSNPSSIQIPATNPTATHPHPKTPIIQSPGETPPAKMMCAELNSIIEEACHLDFATIFRKNDENIYLDRRAFLIFHPREHVEELELVSRWLLMHHVEIHTFWEAGSWDYFKESILGGGTGVILSHADFQRFWSIPDFGKVLQREVRVWSVGLQYPLAYDPYIFAEEPPLQYDCIEIFPHGGIIYITDEVLERNPIEALEIVALFVAKVDKCRSLDGPVDPSRYVDDGCLLWRLAVRPDMMQAIFDWCAAHEAVLEEDPAAQSRAKLYELLLRCSYIELDNPGPMVDRPVDFWPIISEHRDSEASAMYQEYLQKSQAEANAFQVEIFAGTIIDLRRDYRHYFVVHTEPDKVDWQSRWRNIEEIITPEKCIEYFKQPAKGSRFDFYEWAFDDKYKSDRPDEGEVSDTSMDMSA